MDSLPVVEDGEDQNANLSSASFRCAVPIATNDSSLPTSTLPAAETSLPLIEFTIFSRLALELRRKIWKAAAHTPRLIELEFGPDALNRLHHAVHVARPCRQPPAILHTSLEARQEGLRYYSLSDFEVNSPIHPPIYFNGFVDIIYFGKNTCLTTLVLLLRSGLNSKVALRQSISRVAFDVDAPMSPDRCDFSCEEQRTLAPLGRRLFASGKEFSFSAQLKALHGIDSTNPQEINFWPGCRQLKEIIFITKGYDLALSAEEAVFIDDSVTLRTVGMRYESDLWSADHRLENDIIREVKKVRDGKYSLSVNQQSSSRWKTNPPSISFQHLCFHNEAQRVHYNLILSVSSKGLLKVIKDLIYSLETERLTKISLYRKFREDTAVIVKIVGVKAGVEKILSEIRRRLGFLESTLGLSRSALREISEKDSPFSFS